MTRQEQIFNYIKQYIKEHGYSPTTREISIAVDLKSSSTTHGHLQRMKAKGLINFEEGKPRTITICDGVKEWRENL